jgi:PHD/YefM family antitoxin component YafN of YafNO toxin-antitoxin module
MNKNAKSVTIKVDKPVVVISVDEYESMKETIELLSLYPGLLRELRGEHSKIDGRKSITLRDYKEKHNLH